MTTARVKYADVDEKRGLYRVHLLFCGSRDHNGRATCGGVFGFLCDPPGPPRMAVWGYLVHDPTRDEWRLSNHAMKSMRKGFEPNLRRIRFIDPDNRTRAGEPEMPDFVVRRDYGAMGGGKVAIVPLPAKAVCPRCETRQVIPAELYLAAYPQG